MSMNSIRDTFFEECEELLEALVEGLSAMEENAEDMDVVNAVFRSVHSIKGGAGAFGLNRLVGFAHIFETVMDKVRSQEIKVDEELMLLFHRSGDQLADLVEAARDDREPDAESEAAIIKELDAHLGDQPEEEDFDFAAVTLDFDAPQIDLPEADAGPSLRRFNIRFKPTAALYANGHEPLLLFDALAELGTLSVKADLSGVPDFDAFDPDSAVLDWTLALDTSEDETVLHEVFEFVDSLCDLEISVDEAALPDVEMLPEPQSMAEAHGTPDPAMASPPPETRPAPDAKMTEPSQKSASKQVAPSRDEPRGPKPTLRVDLDRVDRLINTVGELIINQAMISQRIEELELPAVAHLTNELEAYKLLARDIQEGVMAIRAQPVKPLFQRMSRIVREASEATGKKSKLITVGDSTEVDKTVIERLADPLTHMVRNAVDHGLESPEKRVEAGKEAIGTIRLSASHRSGSVFIEIADDGAGLNRPRILEKGIEKGLVPPDTELSDQEIDNLLFMPGFSTASEVSNLSGRGVGMDVVKNAVAALGGRVSITTSPGSGTTFTIVLPLTLAVMDGFVISIADQTMVIPIASIIETIRPSRRDLHCIGTDGEVISVRGSYVPIVDVARNLGLSGGARDINGGVLLLVSTEGQGLTALRVGAIHDQRQVVIKSLESNYGAIPGVSAATILGDGKIALILDPDELVKLHPGLHYSPPASPPRMELRHA
ncbi:chemotaxis protein CheA [Salipiger aestuarii]|uniref:Chemotaxis protein CheA n=1 Tax=Salipiger aestuarii TaxID=568098 RepID=A0A327Y7A6_9RHOB|nr:chemotaxis protein CheA [Salipiger aestuarii]KAA8611038.1 chemotaxis protein CheA [Salipiger aestuarii]KAB2542272.1 chemotaxis protein CheA [Salipiger aestuarii]RAK16963.1 two-component system chemotaxis sensor kinase CheA [Salipiger aestuarii]